MFNIQKYFLAFIFSVLLLSAIAVSAQSKVSKYGTICGDASKAECTKNEEIFKPFDLVFDARDYDSNSSDTLFSKYFYAVVLETINGYKESGGCREISEAKRSAAQELFPNNKAFTYNYYCRDLSTGESFIGYQGAGLIETSHFLAVYGGKTNAEAAKILSAAKKKYPKAKIIKMRAGIMFQGDV
jgi:hypothetical protein